LIRNINCDIGQQIHYRDVERSKEYHETVGWEVEQHC